MTDGRGRETATARGLACEPLVVMSFWSRPISTFSTAPYAETAIMSVKLTMTTILVIFLERRSE